MEYCFKCTEADAAAARLYDWTLREQRACQSLRKMQEIYRVAALQKALRVRSQREDRDLQHKLNMLDKQKRRALKTLRRRRESLINEATRVAVMKLCQPKATVNVVMKEIRERKSAEVNFRRGVHTSDGRMQTSAGDHHNQEAEPEEQSRSTSAPPPPSVKTRSSERRHVHGGLSLLQMRNIAAIDSISGKELAARQRKVQEDSGRLRQLQRETLHMKVAAFMETLRDKGSLDGK